MIKAGALLYAIIVSLVTCGILSSILILSLLNRKEIHQGIEIQKSYSYLNMATTLLKSDDNLFSNEAKDDALNNTLKTFTNCSFDSKPWGLYRLIFLKAEILDTSISRCYLMGYKTLAREKYSLYLSDDKKILSIAGETYLHGVGFIPSGTFRKISIEKKKQPEKWQYEHFQPKNCENNLWTLNPLLQTIIPTYKSCLSENDSLIDWNECPKNTNFVNSFKNQTITFYSSQPILLSNLTIKGRIKIISSRSINILSTCKLEDVILVAPELEFESRFTGSVQCFAEKRVIVGNHCNFEYPSIISLNSNESNINSPILEIKQGSQIYGDVIAMQNIINKPANLIAVKMDLGIKIKGNVYSSGIVYAQGAIYGSLTASKIFASTSTSTYEDVLLNTKLDSDALSPNYVGGVWYAFGRVDIAKFLN